MTDRLPADRREILADGVVRSLQSGDNPLHGAARQDPDYSELCALTETAMLLTWTLASEPIPARLEQRLLADAAAFLAARQEDPPPP